MCLFFLTLFLSCRGAGSRRRRAPCFLALFARIPMFFPCLSMRFSWLSHSFLYDLHMLFSCVFLYLFLMLFLCCSRALRAHSHACARVVCLCFFPKISSSYVFLRCFSRVFYMVFICLSYVCLLFFLMCCLCVSQVVLLLFSCVSICFSCFLMFVYLCRCCF